MGEAQTTVFEPEFNRSIKVHAVDQRITSHAGAILVREFDHQLGLTESLASQLIDPRRQDLIRYQAVELLRERIYAMAMAGNVASIKIMEKIGLEFEKYFPYTSPSGEVTQDVLYSRKF